ncbi:hypothetical protein TSUD_115730 [Trifolium subterraneum]|uniref:Gnk2-homologous domain-containing protein n=1 Tax=Trifolium subterraneum TaxID=3900 RepID=A0A2Z6MMM5_TRISU|nr:hypothetical protein TSUD_115730 [Trifolium subterraneum]
MDTPKYKLLLSICLCVMKMITTKATPTYTTAYCTNTTTYVLQTTFETNLEALLFSFSNSNHPNTSFSIVGLGTSDAVNGLFLCRGDINVTDPVCQECLTAAVKEIIIRCPNQTEALIWYDECFLRYTNRYFPFNKIVPGATLDDGNISSGVDLEIFNRSLHGLLNDLVTEVATSLQTEKFASGETAVTESMKLYGLVQCTYDLTESQCETCLRDAIGTLPNGKQGARALLSSWDSKLGPGTIAVVIIVPVVFLMILFLGCYYFKKWSKKKRRLMLQSMTDNCM